MDFGQLTAGNILIINYLTFYPLLPIHFLTFHITFSLSQSSKLIFQISFLYEIIERIPNTYLISKEWFKIDVNN